MIGNNSFSFIYEDEDDCINAPRGIKREYNNRRNVISPLIQYQQNHVTFNLNTEDNEISDIDVGSKRKRLDSPSNFGICSTNFKKSKIANNNNDNQLIPNIVIKQSNFEKSNFNDVLNNIKEIKFIQPNSQIQSVINSINSDLIYDKNIPLLIFLFDYSTISYLKMFEIFKNKNIKIIGITPRFEYYNEQSFPIIIDENGEISKLLNIRDPVGGGIYPIPSIFLFDSFKDEIFRIKLGYDFNIYYDSTIKGNLQNVLFEGIEYTLGI
ncbi:hypothetical protein C6P40_000051 [Pichia californica]|uniref:Thioredoxin-like protein n=1 Tax=Pichia californica TaxID=460514 RepID=A0A9P6WQH0_9ASCO|nr:hypothetical protein C6P42_000803 [[Candida] californica]KAG0691434.1 hypothetical protein C6P40_000051 [[Candida] californica]